MLFGQVNIINLTPHDVTIVLESGSTVVFPSEGIARCSQMDTVVGSVAGIPVTSSSFGEVQNLPAPADNTFFIVSRLVLSAMAGQRSDLLVPNQLVRDEKGCIIGCKSFAKN